MRRRRNGSVTGTGLGLVILVLIIALVAVAAFSRGFIVDENVAVRALETQGFSNIEITGKNWVVPFLVGCDKNDAVRFTARAKNSLGKTVDVMVCAGWPFKGATVRTK